jgi:leucyl aminopeptidase
MDIIRGYGKKTVEIHNTDAEGRLVLADAIAYIQEQEVDTIIDLATLTGACVVALGEHTAGLFCNDDQLAASLLEASRDVGEDMWRMPLVRKLEKGIDTPTADMKNVGPRWGGAITAALFLQRFVTVDRWAHIDIAGPAWAEGDTTLSTTGGTGYGVATLVQFALNATKG